MIVLKFPARVNQGCRILGCMTYKSDLRVEVVYQQNIIPLSIPI